MSLPTTATISLLFSAMSIMKAIVEFNIIRVHIDDIRDAKKFVKFVRHIFDHLPYLTVAAIFQMTSIALILTYLNQFGFIPIVALWIINLIIGYSK